MKIIKFNLLERISQGWTPNWEKFVRWLKERTRLADKALVEANKVSERKKHNDKVLRQYGLGKKNTDNDYWR